MERNPSYTEIESLLAEEAVGKRMIEAFYKRVKPGTKRSGYNEKPNFFWLEGIVNNDFSNRRVWMDINAGLYNNRIAMLSFFVFSGPNRRKRKEDLLYCQVPGGMGMEISVDKPSPDYALFLAELHRDLVNETVNGEIND